ncbi:MAG: hypothetical protein ACXVBH_13790 [Flavisolibacter sp.]
MKRDRKHRAVVNHPLLGGAKLMNGCIKATGVGFQPQIVPINQTYAPDFIKDP